MTSLPYMWALRLCQRLRTDSTIAGSKSAGCPRISSTAVAPALPAPHLCGQHERHWRGRRPLRRRLDGHRVLHVHRDLRLVHVAGDAAARAGIPCRVQQQPRVPPLHLRQRRRRRAGRRGALARRRGCGCLGSRSQRSLSVRPAWACPLALQDRALRADAKVRGTVHSNATRDCGTNSHPEAPASALLQRTPPQRVVWLRSLPEQLCDQVHTVGLPITQGDAPAGRAGWRWRRPRLPRRPPSRRAGRRPRARAAPQTLPRQTPPARARILAHPVSAPSPHHQCPWCKTYVQTYLFIWSKSGAPGSARHSPPACVRIPAHPKSAPSPDSSTQSVTVQGDITCPGYPSQSWLGET